MRSFSNKRRVTFRRGRFTAFLGPAVVFILAPHAVAHHILGIPHYAYDEDYPQTPVLTYRVDMGPHEIKMTGYPGRPEPGEKCSLHVYIRRLDNGAPFDGAVTLTVMRDRMIGEDPVVYGPTEAHLEEAMYKFYPQFQDEANYVARITFHSEGAPWIIDLPMVVGEPGSPFLILGGLACAAVVFVVIVRAVRIKRRRRSKQRAREPVKKIRRNAASKGATP